MANYQMPGPQNGFRYVPYCNRPQLYPPANIVTLPTEDQVRSTLVDLRRDVHSISELQQQTLSIISKEQRIPLDKGRHGDEVKAIQSSIGHLANQASTLGKRMTAVEEAVTDLAGNLSKEAEKSSEQQAAILAATCDSETASAAFLIQHLSEKAEKSPDQVVTLGKSVERIEASIAALHQKFSEEMKRHLQLSAAPNNTDALKEGLATALAQQPIRKARGFPNDRTLILEAIENGAKMTGGDHNRSGAPDSSEVTYTMSDPRQRMDGRGLKLAKRKVGPADRGTRQVCNRELYRNAYGRKVSSTSKPSRPDQKPRRSARLSMKRDSGDIGLVEDL